MHCSFWKISAIIYIRKEIFYRVALKMEGQNSFQEYFSEVMDPYLKYLADQIMGAGKEEVFFLRFFGDAFLMAIIRWIMDENIMQPREFVRQLDETISLGAKKILELNRRNQRFIRSVI